MKIEKVKADFETKEILSKHQIYRWDNQGNRQYFTIKDEQATFYPSVTTILSNTQGMPYNLKKMLADMGWDKYNEYMGQAAAKGTMIHAMISHYIINNEFDFETDFYNIFNQINEKSKYKIDYYENEIEIKKKLTALIKFVQDTDLNPVAIEWQGVYNHMWVNPDMPELANESMFNTVKFAGSVDLIAYIDVEVDGLDYNNLIKTGKNAGKPHKVKRKERKLAIIDFKSGGIYGGHEDQLLMYKMLVEASSNLKVDMLLNVAPKDWRTTPSYTIKNQTDNSNVSKIYHMSMLYSFVAPKLKNVLQIQGTVNGSPVEDNIKWVDVNKFVKNLDKVQYESEV